MWLGIFLGPAMRVWVFGILTAVSLIIAGCALDLDQLVPQSAVSDISNSSPGLIQICPGAGPNAPEALAAKHGQRLAAIQRNIQYVRQVAMPDLAAHPVVNAALQHVHYASATSLVTARRILNNGRINAQDEAYLATISKPPPLSHGDIVQFSHTISETVLRNTGSSIAPDDPAQLFWSRVKAYYTAYYQGNFIGYFSGPPVAKPAVQLTIKDDEVTQAAGIFLELLFDQILSPTVWTDGKNPPGAYYPGGGSKPPTYVGVFKVTPQPLADATSGVPPGACGMTGLKMEALTYLAKTFSTAASGEISITIKSFGGIEVPLGIFGKLNVGDNQLLTDLAQMVVSESVTRLTAAIAAPILEAIEIVPTQSSGSPLVAAAYRSTTRKALMIQMYSTPFISASRKSW
jgi:hypothetical protein